MEDKRLASAALQDDMELLGEGASFQEAICSMLVEAKGFEEFGQHDIEFLARHMKAYRVREGATIFREGERNSYLCVLTKGRVGVYKEDRDNEVKLLTIIPSGRIFGEISIIDNFPYSASIIAETDVTFLLMSRESFRQCVDGRPALGVRLLSLIARLLCARLRAASGQLVDYLDD
jgi:CRP-like cAMP-binding protein